MSTLAAARTAQWVPVVSTVFFFKAIAPELILTLCISARDILLNSYFAIHELVTLIWSDYNLLLIAVLLSRYFRLVVNSFAYHFLYQHDEIPEHPTVSANMAHVIIPTAEPTNADFFRCVLSVLEKRPGWITIVTAHPDQTAQAREVLAELPPQHHTAVRVTTGPMANKRHQIGHVLRGLAANREQNKNVMVVLVDDHVWWPSPNFLSAILAPFENPKVGIVGMHKQPERVRGNTFSDSLLNFIACLYLERHNFEIRASNALDGSAFVVSARTCVVRASIVMEDEFLAGYLDEHFFFGRFGPLNPDDDNYVTRYMVRKNWDIKWQHQPDALMETSLGVTGGYKKFWGQIQRWARSQWRSNPGSVFIDRSIWRRGQLWAGYSFLMSFINFAVVWDSMVVYLWSQSSYDGFKCYYIVALILGSKFVKIAPFFQRNPEDLWLFPFIVIFGYMHSFIKLWALLTFYDHSWSGRNLAAIKEQGDEHDSDNDDNGNDGDDDESDDDHYSLSSRSPSPSLRRRSASSFSSGSSLFGSTASRRPVSGLSPSAPDSPVRSYTFTPWGTIKSSDRQLIPVNAREGQYSSIQHSFSSSELYSTPRMTLRASSQPRGSGSASNIAAKPRSSTTNEPLRGRTPPRNDSILGLPSLPLTPERDMIPECIICKPDREFKTPPRTQLHPRVPDAPRKTSIAFKGANSSLFPDHDLSGRRTELLRRPIGKVPKFIYNSSRR